MYLHVSFEILQQYTSGKATSPISCMVLGPREVTMLAVTGHEDGTIVIRLLPDADGSISLMGSFERLLGVNSKLKIVKGTV